MHSRVCCPAVLTGCVCARVAQCAEGVRDGRAQGSWADQAARGPAAHSPLTARSEPGRRHGLSIPIKIVETLIETLSRLLGQGGFLRRGRLHPGGLWLQTLRPGRGHRPTLPVEAPAISCATAFDSRTVLPRVRRPTHGETVGLLGEVFRGNVFELCSFPQASESDLVSELVLSEQTLTAEIKQLRAGLEAAAGGGGGGAVPMAAEGTEGETHSFSASAGSVAVGL